MTSKNVTVALSLRFSCAVSENIIGRWRIRTSDLCRVNNWNTSKNTCFLGVFCDQESVKLRFFEVFVSAIVARGGGFC